MKNLYLISICLFCVVGVKAQQCPTDKVCISPDAMKFYLARDDKAKALEAEIVVKDKALDDTKQIVNDLKVELAKATGTLTGVQQSAVDLRAALQIATANCKARNRIGLIVF